MSRLMLLGALRAPIDPKDSIGVLQLQGRAKEAATEIERLDKKVAVLTEALEMLRDGPAPVNGYSNEVITRAYQALKQAEKM